MSHQDVFSEQEEGKRERERDSLCKAPVTRPIFLSEKYLLKSVRNLNSKGKAN